MDHYGSRSMIAPAPPFNMNGKSNGHHLGEHNGYVGVGGAGDEYQLQCHNVSYIRSFTTGRWYSKVFNPPITAQFLKDCNIEVHAGEVMGVIGSAGSGKTTLLNVIARRVQGTTAGRIMLNHRPMTERAFQNNCAYVSFKQSLLPSLTVRETLRYQADLGLSGSVGGKEKSERVQRLMSDFELTDHSSRRVEALSESARRRLLIALHLIRDPILILIDEPNRGLDSLTGYQLMYDLTQYMKRYKRMAIVSTHLPRSDIYQLFDRLTILFFGEVVYSGYTKQMPVYFRQIGYPCPATENPAIYYLSLATVDRETSERYQETQEQAVKLIEIFKGQGEPFSMYRAPANNSQSDYGYGNGASMPLSHLGRPNSISRFWTLTRRTVRTYMFWTLLIRMTAFPVMALILTAFYFRLADDQPWTPFSRAGLMFNVMCAASLVSAFLTSVTTSKHRVRYFQESWDNLYGGMTFICSQLFANFIFDLLAVLAGCAIMMWGCNLESTIMDYGIFCTVVWSCWQWSQLITLGLMIFARSSFTAACTSATVSIFSLIFAGGFMKAYTTFIESTNWLKYVTYASIHRYAGMALYNQQVRNVTTGCNRLDDAAALAPSAYCRWTSGAAWLLETYSEEEITMDNYLMNVIICPLFVLGMTVFLVILYGVPLPHFVKRNFRFK